MAEACTPEAFPSRERSFVTYRLAVDRLFMGYLLLTGVLAAVSGGLPGVGMGALHLAAVAGVFALGRVPWPRRRGWRFLRAVYPLALSPLLYMELAILNDFVFSGYFDEVVQGWESAVFGAQLSMEAARRLPSFWVSEFLHLGYFSYYFLVPAAVLAAFARGGAASAHRLAFAVCLAFFACYVTFSLFPVSGPRYVFPEITGIDSGGTFYRILHALLEGGSSRGTAFPSSHVAATAAAVLGTWRANRRWFWVLCLPLFALTVGTVYGRFHYGVDAAAGLFVAITAHAAAPGLVRRWKDWQ